MKKSSNFLIIVTAICSTNLLQSMEAPEYETTAKNKSVEKLNKTMTDYQKETDTQARQAKEQADKLNSDAFKKQPPKTSTTSTSTSSGWSLFNKSESSTPTTSRSSSPDNSGGFDIDTTKSSMKKNLDETNQALNERDAKLKDLNTKSANMTEGAKSFADMAKELKRQQQEKLFQQSKNIKKPAETGPMINELDPDNTLTQEQRDKAIQESQQWINPYDGSKLQEWIDSISEMVMNSVGLQTTAQKNEAQVKADNVKIDAQKAIIDKSKAKINDLQNQIDATKKSQSIFDFGDAKTEKQNKINELTQQQTQARNELSKAEQQLKDMTNSLDDFKKNINNNSFKAKQQKALDAQTSANNAKYKDVKQDAFNNAFKS